MSLQRVILNNVTSGTIVAAGGSAVSSLGEILEHTYLFRLEVNGFENIPLHQPINDCIYIDDIQHLTLTLVDDWEELTFVFVKGVDMTISELIVYAVIDRATRLVAMTNEAIRDALLTYC